MVKLFDGFICTECGSTEPGRRHQFTPFPPSPPTNRNWRLDTSSEAQRRRAYKRHHGYGDVQEEVYERNVLVVMLWASGARQVTVGGAFRLSQGQVSKIVNDPRWSDATELPSMDPALLAFVAEARPDIPAVFLERKHSLSIWSGLGLMVLILDNGTDWRSLYSTREPDFTGFRYRSRRRWGESC